MGRDEILGSLEQELKRGTLVLCVLDRLRQPMYGYSLVTELKAHGIAAETNTLYPLLRRLEGQGLLTSEWDTAESKPRKYYRTTPLGGDIYESLRALWQRSTQDMMRMMEEQNDG